MKAAQGCEKGVRTVRSSKVSHPGCLNVTFMELKLPCGRQQHTGSRLQFSFTERSVGQVKSCSMICDSQNSGDGENYIFFSYLATQY